MNTEGRRNSRRGSTASFMSPQRFMKVPSTIQDVDEDSHNNISSRKPTAGKTRWDKEVDVSRGFANRKQNQRVRTDDPYYQSRPMAEFLADAEKEYQELTRKHDTKNERALRNYRQLAQACRYAEADHEGRPLVYHPSLRPGDAFLHYLAPFREGQGHEKKKKKKPQPETASSGEKAEAQAAENDDEEEEEEGRERRLRQLEVWLPDTVVSAEGGPRWFYTGAAGRLAATRGFPERAAVERLGDVRYETELVALCKQARARNIPGKGARQQAGGNAAVLCSTADLRGFVAEIFHSTPGHETKSVQKYVKSKGPYAFVHRQVLELRAAPFAWMITNKASYEDALADGADLSQILLVQPDRDFSTTITRLAANACTDTLVLAQRLWTHIEGILQKHLEFLVADFTRDAGGRWWLLQVKAFRFRAGQPGLEGGAPAKAPLALRRALQGLPAPDSEEEAEDRSQGDARRERARRAARAAAGARRARPGVPPTRARRLAQCRSCQGWRTAENLPFQMTAKMITTTILHLRRRLPRDGCPEAFRGSLENLLALGRTEKRLPGQGGLSYQHFRVCQLCFLLYQEEAKVIELEAKLMALTGQAATLQEEEVRRLKQKGGGGGDGGGTVGPGGTLGGGPRSPTQGEGAGGQESEGNALEALARLDQVRRWGYELPKWLHCTPVTEKKELPADLSLCRILIAVHQLIDVPKRALPANFDPDMSINVRLVYTILGRTQVATVKSQVIVKSESEIEEEHAKRVREDSDMLEPMLLRRNDTFDSVSETVSLPISFLRVHYFYAPRTPLEDPLPHDSGLGFYLQNQKHLEIALIVDAPSPPKELPSAGPASPGGGKPRRGSRASLPRMMSRAESSTFYQPRPKAKVRRMRSDSDFMEHLESHEQGWLGAVKVALSQFRNAYVKRLDQLCPLAVDTEDDGGRPRVCALQVTVGLERARGDLCAGSLPFPVLRHRGVFLATDPGAYSTSAPWPAEWRDLVPQVQGQQGGGGAGGGAGAGGNGAGAEGAGGGLARTATREPGAAAGGGGGGMGPRASLGGAELPNAVWCVAVAVTEGHHLRVGGGGAGGGWGLRYRFLGEEFYGETKEMDEEALLIAGLDATRTDSVYFKCHHRHLFKGPLSALTAYLKTASPLKVEIGPLVPPGLDISRQASGLSEGVGGAEEELQQDSWNANMLDRQGSGSTMSVTHHDPNSPKRRALQRRFSSSRYAPFLATDISLAELGELKMMEGVYTLKPTTAAAASSVAGAPPAALAPHEFPPYVHASADLYQIGPPDEEEGEEEDGAEEDGGGGGGGRGAADWVPPRARPRPGAGPLAPGLWALVEDRG